MNTNQLETSVLVAALSKPELNLESTVLDVEAIVSLAAKTKILLNSVQNTYVVSGDAMFKRIIAMPGVTDMFDPNARLSEIAAGRMGTFLGMDVLINESVAEDCFAVVVCDFDGTLTSSCMRIVA